MGLFVARADCALGIVRWLDGGMLAVVPCCGHRVTDWLAGWLL